MIETLPILIEASERPQELTFVGSALRFLITMLPLLVMLAITSSMLARFATRYMRRQRRGKRRDGRPSREKQTEKGAWQAFLNGIYRGVDENMPDRRTRQ